MKEKLKNSPLLRRWFYTQAPLVITRPALRETLRCMLYLLGGFLLACGRLTGAPAPFALGLLAAAGGGVRGLGCLAGAAAGYLTMQPFSQGLQYTSAGVLIQVCLYIFGGLSITEKPWFRSLAAGAMTAAVGVIFLLGRAITPLALANFAASTALAAAYPLCYARLMAQKPSAGALAALSSFLVGAAALPGPVNFGVLAAAAFTGAAVRRSELHGAAAMGAACGLGLDAALGGGMFTAMFACGALLGAGWRGRNGWMRLGLFLAGALAVPVFFGTITLPLGAALALGTALSVVLPPEWLLLREKSAVETAAATVEERLSQGQTVLRRLYDAIGADPMQPERGGRIFDGAAERVCRRCRRYPICWEQAQFETYQALSAALPAILERGQALPGDFPAEFSEACVQLGGLTAAVTQELRKLRGQDRSRRRMEEDRVVASRFLLHLSGMLEENARLLREDRRPPAERYAVRVSAAARGGSGRLSGDRGASFETGEGKFYAILCDGAGTGAPAASESLLAVDALTALIRSGMPPLHAMELVNGMYVLRDSASFSTMDLLEIDLVRGRGSLYKWGAAPSYVRSGGQVQRLGAATPPPGLEAAGHFGAEVLPLDLWGGDLVVLLSDGVEGDVEARLRDFSGEDLRALAASLVEEAALRGSRDDMTAAVIQLRDRQKT